MAVTTIAVWNCDTAHSGAARRFLSAGLIQYHRRQNLRGADVFELIKAGGWLMLPLIACSVVAMAIVLERTWALRRGEIIPPHLVAQVWHQVKSRQLKPDQLKAL